MKETKRMRHRTKVRPKKKKRRLKITLLSLLTVLIVAVAGAAALFEHTKHVLNKTHVSTGQGELQADKPLNLLLLGAATGDNSRGGSDSWNACTDSQIVLSLNPKTETTTILSMERDTMTNIMDESGNIVSRQKMDATYPFGYNAGGLKGGANYAMKTIGFQAGIDISNFLVMNMNGFINLVDDLGGIDVINDSGSTITIANTEPQYKATVPYIGEDKSQHVNGEQALVFVRDRDTLPNGDYGRTAHQREVLTTLMKKLKSFDNLGNYEKFLNDIASSFKTNIDIDNNTLASLLAYKSCFKKIVSLSYQGFGATATGTNGASASYQFVPADVELAVQNYMRRSLGESPITKLDSKMISYESYFSTDSPNYFLPSANITEDGKKTRFGIDPDGSLVKLNNNNSGKYLGDNGQAATTGKI